MIQGAKNLSSPTAGKTMDHQTLPAIRHAEGRVQIPAPLPVSRDWAAAQKPCSFRPAAEHLRDFGGAPFQRLGAGAPIRRAARARMAFG